MLIHLYFTSHAIAIFGWRNRKCVRVLCAVIKQAGICQNTREPLRSTARSGVLLNTFRVFWQIPKCFITAHSTVDTFSISFIKYKLLRSFARAVGSYTARATANQIALNMSVILYWTINYTGWHQSSISPFSFYFLFSFFSLLKFFYHCSLYNLRHYLSGKSR
jgi:hypothetical protein